MSHPETIIISDSEEEYTPASPTATEIFHEEDTSKEEDPSEDPMWETEEEPMEEEDPLPPTVPARVPYHPAEPSYKPYRPYPNGPKMLYTPRKRVNPPTRESIPVPTPQPNPPPPHRRVDARRWTWIPETLREWRQMEGIPPTFEIGGPSSAPVPTLTQEPTEQTIPLLIARSARHDHQIRSLNLDIGGMTARLEREELQNSNIYWANQHALTIQQDGLNELRQQLAESQARIEELTQRLNAMEKGETPDHSHT